MRLNPLDDAAPPGPLTSRPGGARGPFQVLLRSPELGVRMEQLSSFCITESALPPRLRELALLEAARAFDAPHSWHAHVGKGREAGLDGDALERLGRGEEPGFPRADEQAVHEFAVRLLHHHAVDDALYAQALGHLGEHALVDLVGCLGTFTALAMLLNAFEVDLPVGASPAFARPSV
ncbi:hypothetical protein KDL01_11540 [Actinospica durhamensis]|uniref:Carboxymuconolactone decarboxylase family protein n=1 Tax=Actinospica durhamensis TaxID=1508375 RepID=A0A941ERR7_9ACTN|nr:hypothetical protein [Actinospica durhamensis]MBR7833904.1 hypothetical protein [Actinospica durhamensis]